MKRILLLLIVAVLGWCGAGIPASYYSIESPLELTALAALTGSVPALFTLAVMELCRNWPLERRLLLALGSVLLRMGLTVGAGLTAYYLTPLVRQYSTPFVLWTLAFYLMTVAAETVLVCRQFQPSTSASPVPSGSRIGS